MRQTVYSEESGIGNFGTFKTNSDGQERKTMGDYGHITNTDITKLRPHRSCLFPALCPCRLLHDLRIGYQQSWKVDLTCRGVCSTKTASDHCVWAKLHRSIVTGTTSSETFKQAHLRLPKPPVAMSPLGQAHWPSSASPLPRRSLRPQSART